MKKQPILSVLGAFYDFLKIHPNYGKFDVFFVMKTDSNFTKSTLKDRYNVHAHASSYVTMSHVNKTPPPPTWIVSSVVRDTEQLAL